MGNDSGGAMQTAITMFEHLAKLPAPDAVLKELKRFNDNMERIQPDLARLASTMGNLDMTAIRNLNTALQALDVNKMIGTVQEVNVTMKNLYSKLWGAR